MLPRKGALLKVLRLEVQSLCEEHGWAFTAVRTNVLRAGSGRTLNVMPRLDATNLYTRLHRAPVAVLYWEPTSIRVDPSERLRDDKVVTLADFCRYKSFCVSLRANGERKSWPTHFSAWIGETGCEDHRDPRCLPLHVFMGARECIDLNLEEAREQFRRSHGQPPARRDPYDRVWKAALPGERHGRDVDFIAGCELPRGHHWDVSAPTRGSARFANTSTTWKVSRRGYLNVYPSGSLRHGDASSPFWDDEQSREADRAEAKK